MHVLNVTMSFVQSAHDMRLQVKVSQQDLKRGCGLRSKIKKETSIHDGHCWLTHTIAPCRFKTN